MATKRQSEDDIKKAPRDSLSPDWRKAIEGYLRMIIRKRGNPAPWPPEGVTYSMTGDLREIAIAKSYAHGTPEYHARQAHDGEDAAMREELERLTRTPEAVEELQAAVFAAGATLLEQAKHDLPAHLADALTRVMPKPRRNRGASKGAPKLTKEAVERAYTAQFKVLGEPPGPTELAKAMGVDPSNFNPGRPARRYYDEIAKLCDNAE